MGMSVIMKGITCCADCAYYNVKKHKCTRATDEGNPTDHFYVDCPLPTVIKAQGWISVNDRLPTYAELQDDCVLVLLEDGAICSTGFDECIEGESIFGEWRQNFDPVTLGATDSDWMPVEGVTHWMPMPALPKEEDEND